MKKQQKKTGKMFGLRSTEDELSVWRAVAAADGFRDLAAWFRWLAHGQLQKQRAKANRGDARDS